MMQAIDENDGVKLLIELELADILYSEVNILKAERLCGAVGHGDPMSIHVATEITQFRILGAEVASQKAISAADIKDSFAVLQNQFQEIKDVDVQDQETPAQKCPREKGWIGPKNAARQLLVGGHAEDFGPRANLNRHYYSLMLQPEANCCADRSQARWSWLVDAQNRLTVGGHPVAHEANAGLRLHLRFPAQFGARAADVADVHALVTWPPVAERVL